MDETGEGAPDAAELQQQLIETHEALQQARADAVAAAAEAASARQQSADAQVPPSLTASTTVAER